jgi:hypothetical protein
MTTFMGGQGFVFYVSPGSHWTNFWLPFHMSSTPVA